METPPAPSRKNHQVVGNIGLFYCAYQLSRRGWNVLPTSRNTRGIDIVAYRPDTVAPNYVSTQVKTLSKQNPVPLGESKEKIMGDYWVIINNAAMEEPSVYILKPEEVHELSKTHSKNGKQSCWLQPKDYCIEIFKDKWERIEPR